MASAAASTASLLARLDLQSPFVTVAVDSDRINATLKMMAAAMSALQTSLDQANDQILKNTNATSALREDLDAQKAKTAALEEKMGVVDQVERRMTALERNVDSKLHDLSDEQKQMKVKLDAAATHITQLQKQRSEDQTAMNKIIADAQRANNEAKEAVNQINNRIDQLTTQFDAAAADAATVKQDLTTVIKVFEIDINAAAAAVGEGKSKSTRVEYVLSLPSLMKLRTDITKTALEELALLRAALNEKLDAKLFYKMEDRLDECLKSAKSAMAMAERAATEVANKVDRAEFKASIERLVTTKADQSDLMSLASKNDIGVLQTAMANLRAEVEKHLSEQQLENRESRLRLANANNGGTSQQMQDQLSDILERLVEVEKKAIHLDDVKADKADLAALQQYVEDTLSNYSLRRERPQSGGGRRTPTNNNDPLMSTPRRRLLSPITRPSSASIPETYKTPNEPLYYTSLPVRPDSPQSRADHSGASTQIFDSNGHRTTATLQQGKPVPAAEHYANMMRVASGETVIPPGFVLHQIPNL